MFGTTLLNNLEQGWRFGQFETEKRIENTLMLTKIIYSSYAVLLIN
jgi:hypothetical protein